jgi:UDP-2,3-diacylglucosamine hydrolase
MTMPARTLALFISDLHLQPSHPETCRAFFAFLRDRAMASESLYLLGDLFEYWAGDDDLSDPFHQSIALAIRAVSDAGVAVFWIAGNRDFLVGSAFAEACGLTLLSEPHLIDVAGQRVVLVHGDAECTDDINYMAFRAQVRDPAWQAQFLAMPLAQRKAIIAGMRQGSKEAHTMKSAEIMDVNAQAIDALHSNSGADIIIHGHTHRPALHVNGARRRYVLPDWEALSDPPRGGWIAISSNGNIGRHDLDGKTLD